MAAIMVVALSANGICFAATGKSAWALFQATYSKNSKEAQVIADNFQKMGSSLVSDNLSFTLEEYWYDADNGMAYFTIRTDSLDGSPLPENDDAYDVVPAANHHGSMQVGHAKLVVNEDKTTIWRYYHVLIAYENQDGEEDEDTRWYPSVMAGGSPDALLVTLYTKDGGISEDGSQVWKDIGDFLLEPTPSMKMKSLDLDYSVLDECDGISITGCSITLDFRSDEKRNYMENSPFGLVELKMKDGSSCYVVEKLPRGEWQILDADGGVITGYKSDEMDISGDSYLGGFACGSGGDYIIDEEERCQFVCMFNRFIDLDDVAAVYVDGIELPMK